MRLTAPQAKFLEYLARNTGDISWSWEKCRPDVVSMVRDLEKKGLLADLPAQKRIRLTDQGRSAVSQIEQATAKRTRIVTA